jgi:hypothetical protein
MADILHLPTDTFGFNKLLVVVDLATNAFDIEKMKGQLLSRSIWEYPFPLFETAWVRQFATTQAAPLSLSTTLDTILQRSPGLRGAGHSGITTSSPELYRAAYQQQA